MNSTIRGGNDLDHTSDDDSTDSSSDTVEDQLNDPPPFDSHSRQRVPTRQAPDPEPNESTPKAPTDPDYEDENTNRPASGYGQAFDPRLAAIQHVRVVPRPRPLPSLGRNITVGSLKRMLESGRLDMDQLSDPHMRLVGDMLKNPDVPTEFPHVRPEDVRAPGDIPESHRRRRRHEGDGGYEEDEEPEDGDVSMQLSYQRRPLSFELNLSAGSIEKHYNKEQLIQVLVAAGKNREELKGWKKLGLATEWVKLRDERRRVHGMGTVEMAEASGGEDDNRDDGDTNEDTLAFEEPAGGADGGPMSRLGNNQSEKVRLIV